MRELAKKLTSHRAIGIPATLALNALGLTRLSRRIAHRCGYIPRTIRMNVPGGPVRILSANGRDQFASEAWYSGWRSIETPLPEVFSALSSGTVIDVGANTGFYALLAAAAGASRIHAFEPLPDARGWLEKNSALNHMTDRIQVIPAAASAQSGEATLYIPKPQFQAVETSASLESGFRPEHAQEITVPVHSLDDYTRTWDSGPNLVKIDVEGHEAAVIEGSREMLARRRPFVCLEVLSEESAARLNATLAGLRYAYLTMTPRQLTRNPTLAAAPNSPNLLLCPEERLDELAQRMAPIGVAITR